MSQINTELNRSASAQISLDSAENGSYAAINNCSTFRPSSTNPARMSEWYSYNHSQTCTLCNTDVTITASTTFVSSFYFYSHTLYYNIVNLGDIQPVLVIDSTNRNVDVSVVLYDAATDQWLGEIYANNTGAATFTGERTGVKTTGNVKAVVNFSSGVAAANFTYRLKLNCPTTLACGTSMTTVTPYCGCGGDTIYHWLDLGTTSRTISVTFTTGGSGGGTQTIEVNYAGSNLTLSGNTGYGTNQTFTFNYTYNGSTSLARVAFINDCWC